MRQHLLCNEISEEGAAALVAALSHWQLRNGSQPGRRCAAFHLSLSSNKPISKAVLERVQALCAE